MDRYDLAAQGSQNGLWDWNLMTSRIHYSPVWFSMLGCGKIAPDNTPEEWFKRIHPEDLESVQREIKTHLEKGSTEFEIHHRMLHQDGCYRWMFCHGMITRDETGNAIRISGSHVNITAEKVVDALTGLPNRLLLLERLTRSIEKSKKHEDFLFAVLIVDLSLFESGINRLETANVDSLVVAAARRLETSLMAYDRSGGEGRAHLVVCSGGEQFVILLDGLSEIGEAQKVAEQLLKVVSAPFEFEERGVYLSASIGIALSITGYGNADEALRDADTALYRAKSFGKSRCEVFDTGILESTQMRNYLEKDLQSALNRNEFSVYYQPIVSLSTQQIVGFEALARWIHHSNGMIMPKEFIPIAEKNGIIIPLDRWVMLQACRQLKVWQENPHIPKGIWISVNLSGLQFTQPSLVESISETLSATSFDANCLILELTEQSMMENPETARNQLMQMRVMGPRIGLDDFGTGCSSLAYLRQFPLDYLKIDLSFVRSIESSPDTVEIIRTISALARQLGLRVIAEGVENSRQLELLRSLNCDYVQGFLFSGAVNKDQAEAFLLHGLTIQEDVSSRPVSAEKCETRASSPSHLSWALGTPRLIPVSGRRWKFKSKRMWSLVAFTALILFFMGGLFSKLNRLNAPPVAHLDTPVSHVREGDSTVIPNPQENGKALTSNSASVPSAAEPETTMAKPVVYTFSVVHDHRLGSCKGILTITQDEISYAPEKGKDSFNAKHSSFTYILAGDRLSILFNSREFRFKSAASTKEQRQSQLLKIYQNLSEFHPPVSLKKKYAQGM
jgi:diguanylate cyclase (GGDEF)-like protein